MKYRPPNFIRERPLERYFVKEVERCGGLAEKFTSPSRKNVPDRICTWPSQDRRVYGNITVDGAAWIDYVELKTTGEQPTPGQLRDHCRRRSLGSVVYVMDTKRAVDFYISFHMGRQGKKIPRRKKR